MQTISPQQILVPKKVYIGDTAELRCTFNSPEQLLKSITKNGTTELLGEEFIQSEDLLNSADFDIQSIKFSPAGVDYYQLSIIFTPWKTGSIQFSPLTITGSQAEETGMPDQSVIISFQPLQIVSLITSESTAANSLRGIQNPLLLPGTTYKLYSAIAIFLVVLIISIRLIVKHESIAFFISSQKLKYKYKKNRKRTIKQLKRIICI